MFISGHSDWVSMSSLFPWPQSISVEVERTTGEMLHGYDEGAQGGGVEGMASMAGDHQEMRGRAEAFLKAPYICTRQGRCFDNHCVVVILFWEAEQSHDSQAEWLNQVHVNQDPSHYAV